MSCNIWLIVTDAPTQLFFGNDSIYIVQSYCYNSKQIITV